MEEQSRINFIRSKKKEMLLLNSNELEIIEKIENGKQDDNNVLFFKYYLLPIEWLDKYKKKYDFLSVIQNFNYLNLTEFSKLESYLENNNVLAIENTTLNIENNIKLSKFDESNFIKIFYGENKNIIFPKHFGLINENLFKRYIKNEYNLNGLLFDIYFTKGKIYITDKNNDKDYIFVCLYNKNEKYFLLDKIIQFMEDMDIKDKIYYINMNNSSNYIISNVDINQNEIKLNSELNLENDYVNSLKSSHFVYKSNVTKIHINALDEDSDINNNGLQFQINQPDSKKNFIYNIKGDLYSYSGNNNNFENNIKIYNI